MSETVKPKKPKPPKIKRRYPLHAVFLIYCLVSLLVAVGAFNANNNLLFWLFGLSMGMLLVSGLVSGTMMMSLRVERLPIEQPRVGQALRVRYRITNRSRWLPVIGLTISERVEASAAREGEQAAALAAPPAGAVAHVPAKSSAIIETVAMPTGRGRLRLTGYEVMTTFPFGIIRKSLWHESSASVIIHPADAPVPDSLIDPASGLLGSGAAATRAGASAMSQSACANTGLAMRPSLCHGGPPPSAKRRPARARERRGLAQAALGLAAALARQLICAIRSGDHRRGQRRPSCDAARPSCRALAPHRLGGAARGRGQPSRRGIRVAAAHGHERRCAP
ncbi:MAG: hypothetical protein QM783_09470 [Phycisphaerales bacterium]